ncbi:hypothetical protein [Nocardia bovistercoris]|uniref:Uncharacterized protein n=1 Tax=Nocardia bovistercoris TaxID=2785916 RepID=A0A931IIM8_9NOCA|nr:hypothetical protein [Nocardia bovistercoris]MBH0781035.1 hypothetical protein [Nocardia bovistercoris]
MNAAACSERPTSLTAQSAHRIMQRHAHWKGAACVQRAAALELLVALGRYVLDSRRCHVRVLFKSTGLLLDFQCHRSAAEGFARSMSLRADSEICIDRDVHPDMPPLPCSRLWP